MCRDRGAFVKTVPTIVGRHDSNVAGRRAAPIPDADREAEQGSYDCESDHEPADPVSESGHAHISQLISELIRITSAILLLRYPIVISKLIR